MPDCGPARHGVLASASGCLARDPAADEEKPMQALSEVLREVKLNGAAFLDAEFSEPWCVVARGRLCRALMPEATHFIHYHYVAEGSCLTRTEDGRAETTLAAGDVVVFPHGGDHLV